MAEGRAEVRVPICCGASSLSDGGAGLLAGGGGGGAIRAAFSGYAVVGGEGGLAAPRPSVAGSRSSPSCRGEAGGEGAGEIEELLAGSM